MKTTAMNGASKRGLVFAAALVAGGALAGTARADEGVEKAISVATSIGGERNDTIRAAGGPPAGGEEAVLGFSGIFSVGPVALGASGELSSATNGITNRTVGGLAGVRLPVAERLRLVVLGEAGARMFGDAREFLFSSTVTPSERSLPYVGGRIGLSWLALEHLDLGIMAFARTDIGEGTMTVREDGGFFGSEPTATTQQVGGFAGGVALQIGFRFDTTRPFHTPPPRAPARSTRPAVSGPVAAGW